MKKLDTVEVKSPSFPDIVPNVAVDYFDKKLWQAICGDTGHWRVGLYSPENESASSINTLEKHSCPELFLLLSGNISLLLEENGKQKVINLEQAKPILVNTWHNGFCPNGKHAGIALIVERDEFITEYKSLE